MDPFQPVPTRKRSDLIRVLEKTCFQKELLGLPCISSQNIETSSSRNTSFILSSLRILLLRISLGLKDSLDFTFLGLSILGVSCLSFKCGILHVPFRKTNLLFYYFPWKYCLGERRFLLCFSAR